MKNLLKIAAGVFVLVAAVIFLIPILGPNKIAKITFHVVDDSNRPLANFPYGMGAWVVKLVGGIGTSNSRGNTDANGDITLKVPACMGTISSGSKYDIPGFYHSQYETPITNIVAGRWQPWNPTVEVVVKPIINPIPMYAMSVRQALGGPVIIPATNVPVGFDLKEGDWVAPYGKGTVSDFVFTLREKIPFTEDNQPFDVIWTLSFSNKGDGIQSLLIPLNAGSALRFPRNAPPDGYQPTLVQELMRDGNKGMNGADGEDQNYFFRVRTVLDKQGNVKSALYGKIAGPIGCGGYGPVRFTYYLNPNPNDRNMEFDPSKNLFQNLSILQQVKAP